MGSASTSISIALMCAIAAALPADRLAFGQGSAGGTLGKTDKSAGGEREMAAPPKRPVRLKEATAASVAGRWKWTADCTNGGHYVGGFQLTQDAGSQFNGVFLQTVYYDIGTITDGQVSNGKISFTRHELGIQHWTGQLADSGKHINGSITGSATCTWEGIKE
jgi:hypothetical protein